MPANRTEEAGPWQASTRWRKYYCGDLADLPLAGTVGSFPPKFARASISARAQPIAVTFFSPEANIRVDLLLIMLLVLIASAAGIVLPFVPCK
jgi:hypothetical protein